MTTISHVRNCQPATMVTFASDLTTQNDAFSARVEQMDRDVDTAMNSWKGEAAAAASVRALSQKLAGNHLSETVVTLADHFNTYGGEMDGYRTALLGIVDGEVPHAGMSVDDEGNVTAPKYPNAKTDVLSFILQAQLDGQAAGFQSRIKTLLVQFGEAEGKAAQAIATDLQLLGDYEKTPDGQPVGTQVQAILDGKAQLPTDPKALHDFWETLTPAEKDALYEHDHYLGNHDGLPTVDRDHYNRMTLQDEFARAQNGDPTVKDKLGDLKTVAAEVNKPDRYLMLLDSQSGRVPYAAIAAGNPDTASNVSTYVPGTSSRPSSIDREMGRADAMQKNARYAGAKSPSVIAWLGYEAPPGIPDASTKHWADTGASALDRFQDGLRASHDGQPSYNTVLGHSYGTTLIGDAASHGRSLNADAVTLVASPGTTVGHASDLHLTGVPQDEVAKHIFATKADNDPVPLYGDVGGGLPFVGDNFGKDPTWSGFGAQTFRSDSGSSWPIVGYDPGAHSEYWNPGNKALQGMGDIIAGHGDQAVAIK
ncbi:hypothetical protein IU500_06865 [Nocardia terpenica]|uniref:alpha/beta hydrolase n=1 Tax=Nocardia terpenica TaxID=455432 RepID=UPI001893D257|nr:alpha/beta hydrolase [Nocardia terpenica]MBF6060497.1 hypothetical protein [Nocardia terpenica]MBF6103757.1 hypothetical protein [Nocardia terpenica]MBF6111869.1 hypothetical protein [Nocardia terpenica]MBF6117978.1 hypothetical protein [Nocardia terpenica]MBF6155296.1 hypothetical protein [Nocardia terpenica]